MDRILHAHGESLKFCVTIQWVISLGKISVVFTDWDWCQNFYPVKLKHVLFQEKHAVVRAQKCGMGKSEQMTGHVIWQVLQASTGWMLAKSSRQVSLFSIAFANLLVTAVLQSPSSTLSWRAQYAKLTSEQPSMQTVWQILIALTRNAGHSQLFAMLCAKFLLVKICYLMYLWKVCPAKITSYMVLHAIYLGQ